VEAGVRSSELTWERVSSAPEDNAMATVTIRVNGREVPVRAEGDTPLLWVLRDELGLIGTKFGCGKGLCGACTVHVNDAPVRSCSVAIGALSGRSVQTIEGMRGDVVAALRRAWIDESVPQCGYCQVGQVMSASALLRTTPSPNDEQIDAAMRGNICRCGTYPRIRAAIHRAARALASHAER